MMLVLMLTVVTGLLAAPTTQPPMTGTTLDMKAIFEAAFKLIDADGNGHIDVSEFLAVFDKYDTNKDQKLSIDEYIHNTQADRTFAKEVYKFIDNDHDGFIPRGDMSRIFKLYDTNNNGVINEHEFIAEYMKVYQEIVKDLGFVPTGVPTAASA